MFISLVPSPQKTLFALTALILTIPAFPISSANINKDDILAAYIYNFAKFVEWPESSFANAESPLNIGIIGPVSYEKTLQKILSEKTINDRSFQLQTFSSGTTFEKLPPLHMLILAKSEANNMDGLLKASSSLPILTVSEIDYFAHKGGIIALQERGRKIQLILNATSAEKSQLKIRSQLQQICVRIK